VDENVQSHDATAKDFLIISDIRLISAIRSSIAPGTTSKKPGAEIPAGLAHYSNLPNRSDFTVQCQ
jgi:hypothetical protein